MENIKRLMEKRGEVVMMIKSQGENDGTTSLLGVISDGHRTFAKTDWHYDFELLINDLDQQVKVSYP